MTAPLITIFSAPKSFSDAHIATIQRNAIASWTKLPGVNVILMGDEAGLAEAAADLGVAHQREIPRSPSGAPRMDAMFRLARETSPSPLYAIVNADILLFEDFVAAAKTVSAQREKFVLMGQRWDANITEPLDFSAGWQGKLRSSVKSQGFLHRPVGSDYFLFPAACYVNLPPFIIGRAGWDNWMIYHARKSGFPAIDATADVMIVHQNHDYAHLPGGKPHYDHPETEENIRLAGGRSMTRFTLLDTDYRLENGKILPQPLTRARLWRRIEAWPLLTLGSTRLSNLLWRLMKIGGGRGSRETGKQ
ncbi:MAG: hypothetical protein CO094_04520 [Anaerolineae bacterium CG_4_9_14_3_um_filter_57_17]|nr:hypothetical protein [bacterium]NCT21973.1 hypothetical protein [bacterium]OIO84582.1 MAG: hypothetical protein AUK01_08885 [Anaerolineae bacterium CG2_30_57_67]PJB67296.1 MAG: hypothetical protein CO094_04520 [Anaerolineae bacterium CG_4_9_14_3_um_filter_57_17]